MLTAIILIFLIPSFPTASFANQSSSVVHVIKSVSACCFVTLVYDSIDKYVYAINLNNNLNPVNNSNIYVISSVTNSVIATIPGPKINGCINAGSDCIDAYLYVNSALYVSYGGTSEGNKPGVIYVIKGTKVADTIVIKPYFSSFPFLAYDNASNEIFSPVGGPESNSNYCIYLGALSSVNKIIKSWKMGCANPNYDEGVYFGPVEFDRTSNNLIVTSCSFAPDENPCGVSLINSANKFVRVGQGLCGSTQETFACVVPTQSGLIYDPSNGQTYIPNVGDSSDPGIFTTFALTPVNKTNGVVAFFPKFYYQSGGDYSICGNTNNFECSNSTVYDPANREMYCAGECWNSSNGANFYSVAINTNNNIAAEFNPDWNPFWYSPSNQEIYAETGANLAAINSGNHVLSGRISIPFSYGCSSNYAVCYAMLFQFDPANKAAYIGNGTNLFVVTQSNSISNIFRIGCFSMVYDPLNKDVFCSGIQRIFVVSS